MPRHDVTSGAIAACKCVLGENIIRACDNNGTIYLKKRHGINCQIVMESPTRGNIVQFFEDNNDRVIPRYQSYFFNTLDDLQDIIFCLYSTKIKLSAAAYQ